MHIGLTPLKIINREVLYRGGLDNMSSIFMDLQKTVDPVTRLAQDDQCWVKYSGSLRCELLYVIVKLARISISAKAIVCITGA